jgi:hypothetical protein
LLSSRPSAFDTFTQIPPQFEPASKQIEKFCDDYVQPDNLKEHVSFSWTGFKIAVDHYVGDKLAIEGFGEDTVSQNDSTLEAMATRIAEVLANTLFEFPLETARDSIIKTFTNLKEASQKGFVSFDKFGAGHNTSWEYRLLLSFANITSPFKFSSYVTTIQLRADIADEQSWFALEKDTKKNFGAEIKGMHLVVHKDFKAPPSHY